MNATAEMQWRSPLELRRRRSPKVRLAITSSRLKNFVKPYDFVLAPIINDVDLDEQTEKPIPVTRFTKKSEEWLNATYYNVRTGKIPRVSAFSSLPPNPECNNTRIFVVNKNVHEVTLGNRASSPRLRVRQKQSFRLQSEPRTQPDAFCASFFKLQA
jgi:hypothetical protein